MRREGYASYMLIGLVLTIALFLGLSSAFIGEEGRMSRRIQEISRQRVKTGRTLYVENCTSCHGTRGEGAVGPALNNKKLLKAASDQVLFATIRTGRPGTTMPAWGQENGGPFTDEDVRNVVSFVRAWEPNAPVIEKDKFVPNAARGANLFASTCYICHGDNGHGGKGKTGPAVNVPERLKGLDDRWYRETITNGRPAKGMPTWGTVLSPNQIDDLVALFSAWRGGQKVATETTVADNLRSALFSLSQRDTEDASFYLDRARPIAFGPAAERFDPIKKMIADGKLNDALAALGDLHKNWPIGDPKAGSAVFSDACSSCHGSDGQGGVGRRLNPSQFVTDSTNAELLQFLLTGRAGTAMRSFQGRLTEQQLANAIAFVRAWQKDRGEAVK